MSPLLCELHQRWRAMFAALLAGGDLAPSARLRAEGLMEAVVLLGECSPGQLCEQMDEAYREVCGESFSEVFGPDWNAFFPFPQIPAMANRAPVFPSTSD